MIFYIHNRFYFCILEGSLLRRLYFCKKRILKVIVYTRYDAKENLFKPTLHSNDILSVFIKMGIVLGVHSLCEVIGEDQESDLRE